MVRYGPSMSPVQCLIIAGADAMTDEAAGAFLKTLEEPPAGVVFILLVTREDRLPVTIASRCQKILFEEKKAEWKPNPEFAGFYSDLKAIKRKGVIEQLGLSARLEKERERIEELLYDLTFFARVELRDLQMVRILLDAVKNIKRKANLRLALDVACLKMGEA
jgi:DNA polymerase III gamma/tau subunit